MARILFYTFIMLVIGAAVYGLIRLHAYLIIRWKNEIEYNAEHGYDRYSEDDDELHKLLVLCGLTAIPAIVDLTIAAYVFLILGDVFFL